ncbi:hypothetical protein JZ751_011770 [Albula glossodonta]|uniref:Glycosyl hydrolase family 38 C-terminal domain-containing protein n=1 Tax=Albula glossodonta TaxID=121402 RepID=A0A8T2PQQ4_9TELE|nr:hypothetical protein JZ751_011770 [Albula glossodonta]
MAKLPLQANFYPMTTMAYIQDPGVRLTLLTGQSLGVASLKSGQLEAIMDRRLMQDDNRGLGQGIQDNKITANSFRLLLEKRNHPEEGEKARPVSYPSVLSHVSSMFLNHPFIPMALSLDFQSFQLSPYSPLASPLPCDVHLVNLRTIQSKKRQDVAKADEMRNDPPLSCFQHPRDVIVTWLISTLIDAPSSRA